MNQKTLTNNPPLSDALDFDYGQIKAFYLDPANTPALFHSCFRGLYDPIKIMDLHLTKMADLEVENVGESSFDMFKKICQSVQSFTLKPSILKLLTRKNSPNEETKLQKSEESNDGSLQAQFVAKWWKTYLSLLEEAFEAHIEDKEWLGKNSEWFNQSDYELLQESLDCLGDYCHWKIMLLRSLCSKEKFFKKLVSQGMMKPEFDLKFDVFYQECLKYFLARAEHNLDMLEKVDSNSMKELMKNSL